MVMEGMYQCPCCDYYTLSARGSYEVCPVCYWEDDGVGLSQLDEESRANHITLRQGRRNFDSIGASDESSVNLVISSAEREPLRRERRATYH